MYSNLKRFDYSVQRTPGQRRISTLHYDISTLLAVSHRHIGADVDFVRSTASLPNSLVHHREESSPQK
jgi:hypothetical protein